MPTPKAVCANYCRLASPSRCSAIFSYGFRVISAPRSPLVLRSPLTNRSESPANRIVYCFHFPLDEGSLCCICLRSCTLPQSHFVLFWMPIAKSLNFPENASSSTRTARCVDSCVLSLCWCLHRNSTNVHEYSAVELTQILFLSSTYGMDARLIGISSTAIRNQLRFLARRNIRRVKFRK